MYRYWVQDNSLKKVSLKTNDLEEAIAFMEKSLKEIFIWDCINKKVVEANYNCRIANYN